MTASPADAQATVHAASLLASRLCHDLVNPVGALNTGLEVLAEEQDAEMRQHAMNLIRESTEKTVALLTFARMAFGASGAWEGTIDTGEAKALAEGLYHHAKADLEWAVPPGPMGKAPVRILLNLVLVAERCVPRAGSRVTAEMGEAGEGRLSVTARGPRAKLPEALTAALSGDERDLEAKAAPGYLAYLLAAATGGAITARQEDEAVVFEATGLAV